MPSCSRPAFTGYVVTVLPFLPSEITGAIALNALVVACVAGLITFLSLRTKKTPEVDDGTKQTKITEAAPK